MLSSNGAILSLHTVPDAFALLLLTLLLNEASKGLSFDTSFISGGPFLIVLGPFESRILVLGFCVVMPTLCHHGESLKPNQSVDVSPDIESTLHELSFDTSFVSGALFLIEIWHFEVFQFVFVMLL